MDSRIISVDPLTGAQTVGHFDHADDSFTVENRQDAEAIIDLNRRVRNEAGGDYSGEMVRVASIPLVVLHDLIKQGIVGKGSDPSRFKAWLNDRENRVFRTNDGVV